MKSYQQSNADESINGSSSCQLESPSQETIIVKQRKAGLSVLLCLLKFRDTQDVKNGPFWADLFPNKPKQLETWRPLGSKRPTQHGVGGQTENIKNTQIFQNSTPVELLYPVGVKETGDPWL